MGPSMLSSESVAWLWLIPLLPLLGFVVNGVMALTGARSKAGPSRGFASFIAVLMPALSFALTIAAAIKLAGVRAPLGQAAALDHQGFSWFSLGSIDLHFGLHFDALTSLMLLFVTGIGSLIVLYSSGYMAADRGLARFMSYLNLFLFSMIMLVMGDNILVTFLGWEGVGLCSYLLIGFWHTDHANNDAARKAFIVNRIGDLGFLLGVFALLAAVSSVDAELTLDYVGLAEVFRGNAAALQGSALVTAATVLLFIGCTGKSAQIPLMVWLPDAMAGPTPVSALIHAATMVTSGVFLLARLSDVFVLAPGTMDLITWIALATMLWAAIAALFQWDIKKVLAYSTVSQLGFMFLAAGVGRFDVALFHVFTHAFFKATLFLGAGSVIHELHHEQDMRKMGGLRKVMPVTFASMVFAWWAICGLPGGAGFFSKDLILEYAFEANPVLWVIAVAAAALTAFYMTRLMCYTFWSKPRSDTPVAKIHDPDWRMSAPVFVLGLGSLFSGLLWFGVLDIAFFSEYLAPVVGRSQAQFAALHETAQAVAEGAADDGHHGLGKMIALMAVSVAVAAAAASAAYFKFRSAPNSDSDAPVSGFGAAWTWGFDRVYETCLVKPTMVIGRFVDRVIDQGAIAPAVRSVGGMVDYLGAGYRSFQRGQLRVSLAISVLCLTLILGVVLMDLLLGGVH